MPEVARAIEDARDGQRHRAEEPGHAHERQLIGVEGSAFSANTTDGSSRRSTRK